MYLCFLGSLAQLTIQSLKGGQKKAIVFGDFTHAAAMTKSSGAGKCRGFMLLRAVTYQNIVLIGSANK